MEMRKVQFNAAFTPLAIQPENVRLVALHNNFILQVTETIYDNQR